MSLNYEFYEVIDDNFEEKIRLQNEKELSILKTQIMASFVPDLIIVTGENYDAKKFDAAVLFADVSGFTDLSEKCSELGSNGASKLSSILNSYIGSMVHEILSHGGDVFKFSGDAFLVLFEVKNNENIQVIAHEATNTALNIQSLYGQFKTDIGITLNVKIAVSVGEVHFSIIGDKNNSHYMAIGQPVWDVKIGEAKCIPGEVIICPSALNFLYLKQYSMEKLRDGSMHCKLLGFSKSWIPIQRNSIGTMNEKDMAHPKIFSLRSSMEKSIQQNLSPFLERFITQPLMNALSANENLEYLTEMRNVVIVFVNTIIKKTLSDMKSMLKTVDQAYKAVCRIVKTYEGVVNKVSFFDKDLMFLVIFGLRGYKHKNECRVGLTCAYDIYETLNGIESVLNTSIGVTTGLTYCGIVGHTLRREYSVIGLTVNKAARLMIYYPNIVSCDFETLNLSQLNVDQFRILAPKQLKGIKKVGALYEYDGRFRRKSLQSSVIEIRKSESSYMILYDRLTSYEQLLCKGASVLGSKISKSLVRYLILPCDEDRLMATFTRFFELGLLSCCCNCAEVKVTCEWWKFCSQIFQQTVYSSLTETQKRNFHTRAQNYLKRETRMCDSCGNGNFMHPSDSRYIPKYRYSMETNEYVHINEATKDKSRRRSWVDKLTKTLSNPLDIASKDVDQIVGEFSKCECTKILSKMYKQLIIHAKAAGNSRELIEFQIESADISIQLSNVRESMDFLEQSLELMVEFEKNNPFDNLLIAYIYGRIYMLLGRCYHLFGNHIQSLEYFHKSCRKMGLNFPQRSKIFSSIELLWITHKLKWMVSSSSENTEISPYFLLNKIGIQISECLSFMYQVFLDMEKWGLAKYAAFFGLQMAIKYKGEFNVIVSAITNVLLMCFQFAEIKKYYWIQEYSFEFIGENYNNRMNVNTLTIICNYYQCLIMCQIVDTVKDSTIELGFVLLKISSNLTERFKLSTTALQVYLLSTKNRLKDIIKILSDLKMSLESTPNSNHLWYYALCLDITLDYGYNNVSVTEYEEFLHILNTNESQNIIFDGNAVHRFYANLLLKSVRDKRPNRNLLNYWNAEQICKLKLNTKDYVIQMCTALRVFEALLEIRFLSLQLIEKDLNRVVKLLDKNIKSTLQRCKCFQEKYKQIKLKYNRRRNAHQNV